MPTDISRKPNLKMNLNQMPPILFARAFRLWFDKRIKFPKDVIDTIISEEEDYKVFRKVIVLQKDYSIKSPSAIFKVKFQFAKFTFATNKRLSLIPIPLIIAQPGFISKTWLLGLKTGCFQGYYEWESLEAANNYENSFPFKMMKKRAKLDSIDIHIQSIIG